MKTMCTYFFISISMLCASLHTHAHARDADTSLSIVYTDSFQIEYLGQLSDSSLKVGNTDAALKYAQQALQLARRTDNDKAEAQALVYVGNAWAKKGRYHKALAQFNKSIRLKKAFPDRTKMANLYHDMAIAFTNLKMYPQALKYHYKALTLYQRNRVVDTVKVNYTVQLQQPKPSWPTNCTVGDTLNLPDVSRLYVSCDNEVENDIDTVDVAETEVPSMAINHDEIPSYFNDGKVAVSYGVMLHVKQPAPGKRKTFVRITTVGHVFVTLIKFNSDCSTTSRSFGFYPKRSKLFSATPLRPEDLSTFKDDGKHSWDEIVGKLIDKGKFDQILQLVDNYKNKKYHLNTSNCTDFGLDAAAIAGINILNTTGSWPGGKGNNPGFTGESILEGQVNDTESSGLFIYSTVKK